MHRRVRQFFWSMMAIGTLLVFTNLAKVPPEQVAKLIAQRQPSSPVPILQGVVSEPVDNGPTGRNSVTWNGKPFVFIDGKWYPKSADDIYAINGVKTYFVDETKNGAGLVTVAKGQRAQESEGESAESLDYSPLSAYSPATVYGLMVGLKSAKTKMLERDRVLEEIDPSIGK